MMEQERRRYFFSATQIYKVLRDVKLQLQEIAGDPDDTISIKKYHHAVADDGKTSYKIHGDSDKEKTYMEILPSSPEKCTVDLYRDGIRIKEAASMEDAIRELVTYDIRKSIEYTLRKIEKEKETNGTGRRRSAAASSDSDPELELSDLLKMAR